MCCRCWTHAYICATSSMLITARLQRNKTGSKTRHGEIVGLYIIQCQCWSKKPTKRKSQKMIYSSGLIYLQCIVKKNCQASFSLSAASQLNNLKSDCLIVTAVFKFILPKKLQQPTMFMVWIRTWFRFVLVLACVDFSFIALCLIFLSVIGYTVSFKKHRCRCKGGFLLFSSSGDMVSTASLGYIF